MYVCMYMYMYMYLLLHMYIYSHLLGKYYKSCKKIYIFFTCENFLIFNYYILMKCI